MHYIRKENEDARREERREEENLSTADIANPQPANPKSGGPRLVDDEAAVQDARAGIAADRRTDPQVREQQFSPLFPENDLRDFRGRWDRIQTSFVDEPRKAVEEADSLVASMVKRIAEQFAGERGQLEKQWDRGDNVSTEDLRQALRRYRSFFDRLLSV